MAVASSDGADLAGRIRAFVEPRRRQIIDFLGQLIDQRGGSEDREAVNRVGALLAARMTPLGFTLQRHTPRVYGDHLVFKNHSGPSGRTRQRHQRAPDERPGHASALCPDNRAAGPGCVVLAGHMDTTFTDYSELPAFHVAGEHAVGPGTADMRGGLLVALEALECLHHLGLLRRIPVTVICNSDEERGSSTSRHLFEAEAASARWALVFECAGRGGEVVVGRRGKLSVRLSVEGRAGHAADRSLPKASAIEEIAHKVIALEALNDGRPGASFNVGLIRGGTAGNTFPRHASIDFDVRYLERPDRAWVEEQIARIADSNRADGVKAQIEWTSERPVWEERTDDDDQATLLETIAAAAKMLELPYATEFRHGTSDANFLASGGVATVDGMGPVGFQDHSDQEHIVLETLFERIRLTAIVLHRLYPQQGC